MYLNTMSEIIYCDRSKVLWAAGYKLDMIMPREIVVTYVFNYCLTQLRKVENSQRGGELLQSGRELSQRGRE